MKQRSQDHKRKKKKKGELRSKTDWLVVGWSQTSPCSGFHSLTCVEDFSGWTSRFAEAWAPQSLRKASSTCTIPPHPWCETWCHQGTSAPLGFRQKDTWPMFGTSAGQSTLRPASWNKKRGVSKVPRRGEVKKKPACLIFEKLIFPPASLVGYFSWITDRSERNKPGGRKKRSIC